MAQIIIKDLPEEIVERLRNRAALEGRTLENEIHALLSSLLDPIAATGANDTLAATMARTVCDAGLSEEAWRELDRSLLAARASRSDSIHRWIDFDGPEFDHLDVAD